MLLSEPAPPQRRALAPGLQISVWDRWELQLPNAATVRQLFDAIEAAHPQVVCCDVVCGTRPVFLSALQPAAEVSLADCGVVCVCLCVFVKLVADIVLSLDNIGGHHPSAAGRPRRSHGVFRDSAAEGRFGRGR